MHNVFSTSITSRVRYGAFCHLTNVMAPRTTRTSTVSRSGRERSSSSSSRQQSKKTKKTTDRNKHTTQRKQTTKSRSPSRHTHTKERTKIKKTMRKERSSCNKESTARSNPPSPRQPIPSKAIHTKADCNEPFSCEWMEKPWIKVAHPKYPSLSYYFNEETEESKWELTLEEKTKAREANCKQSTRSEKGRSP